MGKEKGSELLLKATKINKSFGNFTANKDIDIDIAKGEIHALLGENGACLVILSIHVLCLDTRLPFAIRHASNCLYSSLVHAIALERQ